MNDAAVDRVIIPLDRHPQLAEALRDSKPGDDLKLEIHGKIVRNGPDSLEMTNDTTVPDGYEIDKDSENPGQMAGMGEGGMTPAAMMVRKKRMGM